MVTCTRTLFQPPFDRFHYTLEEDPTGLFSIGASTGTLTLSNPKGLRPGIHELIIGTEEVHPSEVGPGEREAVRGSTARVMIVVEGEEGETEKMKTKTKENSSPKFIPPGGTYTFTVPSTATKPYLVGSVKAIDPDEVNKTKRCKNWVLNSKII